MGAFGWKLDVWVNGTRVAFERKLYAWINGPRNEKVVNSAISVLLK
jgi:hypothetical protein